MTLLEKLGLERADFDLMCSLYKEWNGKINVVSRKDIDNVFEHHILHSLFIAAYLADRCPEEYARWRDGDAAKAVRVLDLGCGGGFPGIPLAMCFPKVQFTLCDSVAKKILVSGEVASSLGLKNVELVNGRGEELSGRWDWAVSRAVAPLDKLLLWTAGKTEKGLICLKGGDLAEEMAECGSPAMLKFLSCFGLKTPSVELWRLENATDDEYYKEKVVVNLVNCQK